MKLLSLVSIFYFIGIFAVHAGEVDYDTQIITRSYPAAFVARNRLGYGQKFWESDKNKVLYGYVRAGVKLDTSAVVNTVGAELEVFPISFFGAFVGASTTDRGIELKQFDCEILTCKDRVNRTHVGLKLALKFGPVFFTGMAERVGQKLADYTGRDFADEQTSLIAGANGDTMERLQLVAGIETDEKWRFGVLFINQDMLRYENSDQKKMFVFGKQYEKWSWIWGNGVFKTRTDANVFSTMLVLQWNGKMGVRLF